MASRSTAAARFSPINLWPIAVIVALAFVAFAPALGTTWIWDDDSYVTGNRALRSLDGLWRIWTDHRATPQYYPLVFTTFWLECHLYGHTPVGYHIVNVLLHAATACGLYFVLRHLRLPGAVLAAVLFMVHPMMVESVAWVTERKNVLSGCLYFASAWCLLRSRAVRIDEADDRSTRVNLIVYGGALALFVGALLSKSVTGSLPAAALLVVYWKRGRVTWRDVAWLLPLFALAIPLGMHTAWLERHHVGAEGPAWVYGPTRAEDFLARCLIAGRAVWFYVGKFLWPVDLAFIYSRFHIDVRSLWQWLFPAAVVAVVMALFALRRRVGRGPVVAVLFFVGTALPALGFFDVFPHRYSFVYSFVADHFVYLALVGLIAMVSVGVTKAYQRLARRRRQGWIVGGVGVVMILLIVQTARQCLIYENTETLWRDTLAKSPDAWVAHTNFAATLVARGDYAAADSHYEQALRLEPNVHDTHSN